MAECGGGKSGAILVPGTLYRYNSTRRVYKYLQNNRYCSRVGGDPRLPAGTCILDPGTWYDMQYIQGESRNTTTLTKLFTSQQWRCNNELVLVALFTVRQSVQNVVCLSALSLIISIARTNNFDCKISLSHIQQLLGEFVY